MRQFIVVSLFSLSFIFLSKAGFAAGYDPAMCAQSLQQKGFDPCGETACQAQKDNPAIHAFCSGQGVIYSPVQAVVCKNSKTGEERSAGTSQIITTCSQLAEQDPSWNLSTCYCCCA